MECVCSAWDGAGEAGLRCVFCVDLWGGAGEVRLVCNLRGSMCGAGDIHGEWGGAGEVRLVFVFCVDLWVELGINMVSGVELGR